MSLDAAPPPPTLYFAYGSNLWQAQMRRRCPTSTFLGIATLARHRWIINARGYANVVCVGDDDGGDGNDDGGDGNATAPVVWGLVYALRPADEAALDAAEGVPHAYGKASLGCEFWARDGGGGDGGGGVQRTMLVYVDGRRTAAGVPRAEYVDRM